MGYAKLCFQYFFFALLYDLHNKYLFSFSFLTSALKILVSKTLLFLSKYGRTLNCHKGLCIFKLYDVWCLLLMWWRPLSPMVKDVGVPMSTLTIKLVSISFICEKWWYDLPLPFFSYCIGLIIDNCLIAVTVNYFPVSSR